MRTSGPVAEDGFLGDRAFWFLKNGMARPQARLGDISSHGSVIVTVARVADQGRLARPAAGVENFIFNQQKQLSLVCAVLALPFVGPLCYNPRLAGFHWGNSLNRKDLRQYGGPHRGDV